MKRWELMREFQNVAALEPMRPHEARDTRAVRALERAALVLECSNGRYVLTHTGAALWDAWKRLPEEL